MFEQKQTLSLDLPTAIRQAVEDLKQCANDPKYKIDLGFWHHWGDGVCHICFAGAVMARRLGVKQNTTTVADEFEGKENIILHALNYIRNGHVGFACKFAGITLKKSPPPFPRYYKFPTDNPKQFYDDMLAIADWIEKNKE